MRTLAVAITVIVAAPAQENIDARVEKFLDSKAREWRDLNVPAVDGQTLHDIIVKHKYTRALEIGTSTGHSGIWIACAAVPPVRNTSTTCSHSRIWKPRSTPAATAWRSVIRNGRASQVPGHAHLFGLEDRRHRYQQRPC